jgi:hypothetical protein
MRLLDLELSVGRQLSDLPDPAYLLAMSVIGKHLAEIYAGFFPGEVRLLAAQTVEAVKAAYRGDGPAADDLWQLHQRWAPLFEPPEPDGPLGMYGAMETLYALVREMTGKTVPHHAADVVANADILPDPAPPGSAGPYLVRIDTARQADESSPAVQLLRKFEEVARLAASQHRTGLTCDPDRIYAVVFG